MYVSDSSVNPKSEVLGGLLVLIRHYFHSLSSLFSPVEDVRRAASIHYSLECVFSTGLLMFLCRLGARHMITSNLRYDSVEINANYKLLFDTESVPHGDTVNYLFCKVNPEQVQDCLHKMIRRLLRKKVLYPFRLLDKYFRIAIDGTRLFSFKERHCPHCLKTKHKNGSVTYYHVVLEAKLLLPNGFAFSIMSEFVENEHEQVEKQDCELKAFYRLAARLKAAFPQLPLVLLLDGLYANGEVFEICRRFSWKYLIVLKDDDLPVLHQEYKALRLLQTRNNRSLRPAPNILLYQHFNWVKQVEYIDTKRRKHLLNVIECRESLNPSYAEEKDRKFKFITNLNPTEKNVPLLCQGGRDRWKIENEGFNVQKNQDFELEHAYTKHPNGWKVFYLVLQMSTIMEQLLFKSNLLPDPLKKRIKTAKNLANRLLEAWRNYQLTVDRYEQLGRKRVQIRLDSS